MQLEQLILLGKSNKEQSDLKFKYDELEAKTALELTKLEAVTQANEEANFKANEEAIDEGQY